MTLRSRLAHSRGGTQLVALSFVRRADDVTAVRTHTRLPLIAKIEKPQAVQRISAVVRAADCVMVAREDDDEATLSHA